MKNLWNREEEKKKTVSHSNKKAKRKKSIWAIWDEQTDGNWWCLRFHIHTSHKTRYTKFIIQFESGSSLYVIIPSFPLFFFVHSFICTIILSVFFSFVLMTSLSFSRKNCQSLSVTPDDRITLFYVAISTSRLVNRRERWFHFKNVIYTITDKNYTKNICNLFFVRKKNCTEHNVFFFQVEYLKIAYLIRTRPNVCFWTTFHIGLSGDEVLFRRSRDRPMCEYLFVIVFFCGLFSCFQRTPHNHMEFMNEERFGYDMHIANIQYCIVTKIFNE